MRILVDIGHPAHVHLFKNMIWNLEKNGHEIKITARNKDIALYLLDVYGFEYENLGGHKKSTLNKALYMVKRDYALYKVAKKFKPDILVGATGNLYVAHVSKLISKPSIIFDDTEHAKLELSLCVPFASVICTPSCFKKDLGKKQVRYNGYHELAYLHPNYFKLDPCILDDLGLSKDDKFFVLRFVSWNASHDTHSKGFLQNSLENIIKSLEQYGRVFITSEQKLNRNLEQYKLRISHEKLHSVLYYANLHIGEGGSTAVEAALLGTPTVHFEAFKSKSGEVMDATHIHGIFDELVNKYGLIYTFAEPNLALNKTLEILQDKNAKKDLEKKILKLLKEKIDVTAFMTNFIENYPESLYAYKVNGNK